MRIGTLMFFIAIVCSWPTIDGNGIGTQNMGTSKSASNGLAYTLISKETQDTSLPLVKLQLSHNEGEPLSWGAFVRYTIEVSDEVDGNSKYGEINNNQVLLEIEYLPNQGEKVALENKVVNQNVPEPEGLSLMMGSTCFSCHADKEMLAGPSFAQIADRYDDNTKNLTLLAQNIWKGSSGQWGTMQMPAHPDLTLEETQKIAEFILAQGSRKNHKIMIGLEGTFQVLEKPKGQTQGTYRLTASYTSSSSVKGQQRILLPIK